MWKAFPEDNQMQRSFWLTCHGQQKQNITLKVYNAVKNNLMNEEVKRKISASRKRTTEKSPFGRNQT
jgi:hypothetical protein